MSVGKSGGQVRSEIDAIGAGQVGRELVERGRRRPGDRRPHLRDQRGGGGDVELPAVVVDRRLA